MRRLDEDLSAAIFEPRRAGVEPSDVYTQCDLFCCLRSPFLCPGNGTLRLWGHL